MNTITTTKENLAKATNAATVYCKINKRKHKIAYKCEQFLDANKDVVKLHSEGYAAIQNKYKLLQEIQTVEMGHEKGGVLAKDQHGNIEMSKVNSRLMVTSRSEWAKEIKKEIESLNSESVDVKVFDTEIEEIPEDMDYTLMKALDGFVFKFKVPADFEN